LPISNHVIAARGQCPVEGSHTFAISGRRVLFYGDYDDRSDFISRELRAHLAAPLVVQHVAARGSAIWFLSDARLYCVNVPD
jgi:hypothetical protein